MLCGYRLVVADMLAHYRVDLLGADRAMTWRRFTILLTGLPSSSAFWTNVATRRAVAAQAPLDGVDAERYVLGVVTGG